MIMQLQHGIDGRWVVQLDFCQVPFRHQREAETYLSKLKERVDAPHTLPGSVLALKGR
jgi:hypothetical protein